MTWIHSFHLLCMGVLLQQQQQQQLNVLHGLWWTTQMQLWPTWVDSSLFCGYGQTPR